MVPSEESRIRLFCIQYWGAMFPSHGHVIVSDEMSDFLSEWVEEVASISTSSFDEDDVELAFEYTLINYFKRYLLD